MESVQPVTPPAGRPVPAAFLLRHRRFLLRAGVLFFLFFGLGYSLYLGDELRYPDEGQYYRIAVHLAAGDGYTLDGVTPTAIRPPGYPLFLALFVRLGAPIVVLRYLNFIMLALAPLLIRGILRSEKAEQGAGLSAVLLVFYAVLFYTAGTLYPQTLVSLLLLLLLRLAVAARFTWLHAIGFGLLSGAMVLVHPTTIFLPPLVMIWMILPNQWHILRKGIVSALVAVACLLAWSWRNYTVFHYFVPVSTHGCDTFYMGNNPETGQKPWYESVHDDVYRQALLLPEAEQNRYFMRRVLTFWKQQPAAALRLYLEKLVGYFNFRNDFYVASEFGFLQAAVMFLTYYPLLLCLLFRLLAVRHYPLTRLEILLASIYLASALFHALFLPRIRFRLPYDVILIIHIGLMLTRVAENRAPVTVSPAGDRQQ